MSHMVRNLIKNKQIYSVVIRLSSILKKIEKYGICFSNLLNHRNVVLSLITKINLLNCIES